MVTIFYIAILSILSLIFFTLSEAGQMIIAFFLAFSETATDFWQLGILQIPVFEFIPLTPFGLFFSIAPWVFIWIVDLGYIIYCRSVIKEEPAGYFSLLEGFNLFAKALFIRLVYTILIVGGFALFFIPGMIALCAFSQVNFLLIDHPEKNIFWHFSESIRLMRGRKWEYFKLMLSFIGWRLLSGIRVISYAVQLWLYPYSTFTFISYYHDLTGQTPAPVEGDWKKPGMF